MRRSRINRCGNNGHILGVDAGDRSAGTWDDSYSAGDQKLLPQGLRMDQLACEIPFHFLDTTPAGDQRRSRTSGQPRKRGQARFFLEFKLNLPASVHLLPIRVGRSIPWPNSQSASFSRDELSGHEQIAVFDEDVRAYEGLLPGRRVDQSQSSAVWKAANVGQFAEVSVEN